MKFLKQFVLTSVSCFLLQQFLPWWIIAIASASAAFFIGNKPIPSFLVGALSICLLWTLVALSIDLTTASILTQKMNKILPLNAFLLTGILGALVGGLSALTGSLLKRMVKD
jgi:hypothetical protein